MLNDKNDMVKRMWNYYNEPNFKEKEKIEEIRRMIQRKRKLERELEKEERKNERKYREATKKEENEFREEIIGEFEEEHNPKEFIKKNMIEALGYMKQKKESRKIGRFQI
ncbi:MAG TPA: hypothetical protein VMX55_09965 [candidate division Zixibacteria bacterium]|nr:hypothetical protein [candidate division Zixibacteria bacterium]